MRLSDREPVVETVIVTYNLEEGHPDVETARRQLHAALRGVGGRRSGAVKLIHGYGSRGSGGRIRSMVRRELALLLEQGKVRAVVPGELFSPFEPVGQRAILLCFELTKDRDYQKCNQGITMVIL